jgi:hypothetical protein
MNNIERHRAFIKSLEGEKGLREEMHGWRFDTPLSRLESYTPENVELYGTGWKAVEYFIERCRRAESRQIPELKERVKELVRDVMDAEKQYWSFPATDNGLRNEFRALCAEVKP